MQITVNNIPIHYHKTGQGLPLLLLHGNGEDLSLFDGVTRRLAPHFTVYALDTRGHGQSGSGEFNYTDMAEDVAAFIAALNLAPAIVVGFSDGGISGLLLAATWPDRVRRLVVAGANLTPNGIKPVAHFVSWLAYLKERAPLEKLMLTQPHITRTQLAAITAPTLVLAGAHDVIRPAETRRIAHGIPTSQLTIVPGASHNSYVQNGAQFFQLLWPFLRPLAK